jgi:hypothetical protein
MGSDMNKAQKRAIARQLAETMISKATRDLQWWVNYREFQPALTALLEQHVHAVPGGAPAWYERNSGATGIVYPDRMLGVALHQWHSGQDDPIYALGSLIYAGQPVPAELVEDTIGRLESLRRREKGRKLKAELKSLIAALKGM